MWMSFENGNSLGNSSNLFCDSNHDFIAQYGRLLHLTKCHGAY